MRGAFLKRILTKNNVINICHSDTHISNKKWDDMTIKLEMTWQKFFDTLQL